MNCLCDFVSSAWVQFLEHMGGRKPQSVESILDNLASRQIQIEIQARRCMSEARRLHSCGSKALFRSKMLEHRRLQSQLMQMQRFKENAQAKMDAMSHHEINQAFVKAMQKVGTQVTREEAISAMEDVHESMKTAKELTELLAEPVDDEVLDEDLEQEFFDTVQTISKNEVVEKPILSIAKEEPIQLSIREPQLVIPLLAAS